MSPTTHLPYPPRHCRESGSALVIALVAMLLLSALGAAVLTLTNTERAIASNYRAGSEMLYAAEAIAERAMQDLAQAPGWDSILSGASLSGFADASVTPTMRWGSTVDLSVMTAALQTRANATNAWGPNGPQWRLFAYGPLSRMAGPGAIQSDAYGIVWIADDPSEDDGNPQADTNGVIDLLAQSLGPGGARRTIQLTVVTTASTGGPAAVRLLSWREIR